MIRVHFLLTEETSKTEDRLYSFCRRGFWFSREGKSDFVSGRRGSMFEDTSKTESRRCWFRWRGDFFNREEKSDSGFYETWKNGLCMVHDFVGFEDDGSRELGRFSIK